jgi:pimeloyl-ACP methyl ester carboxylesterase
MTCVQRNNYIPATEPDAPLVVIAHGLLRGPSALGSVRSAVREAFPGCAIYMPHTRFIRARPLERITADLVDAISELVAEGRIRRIVLIGHSIGALIVRRAAVLAHGESKDAPFEECLERFREAQPWAGGIERLVLLAGLTRGWTMTSAHNWWAATSLTLTAFFAELLTNGQMTVLGARRGSPFVVQTRLQWLALVRRNGSRPIPVVQLLGSVDDVVSPEDTVDYAVDLGNESFVLMELPHTDHHQAVECEGDEVAQERRRQLIAALTRDPAQLRASGDAIPAQFAADGPPPVADSSVTDLVFVIHGIRDRGFWTQKIARKVMTEAAQAGRNARSMTLSYGYLAMLPFILPSVRRAKTRWLMDRYADYRALYPEATFYYVGHSNGTYLVARALRDYPAARFKRIVLAGSVVRADYDWQSLIAGSRGGTEQVLNYVASADWVVAIFPHGLTPFKLFDLGGAGHHGFDQLAAPRSPGDRSAWISSVRIGQQTSHQVYFVGGGHSAGIRESQWDDIARFIVHGSPPHPADPDYVHEQRRLVRVLGSAPPAAFAAAAIVLLGILTALCYVVWAVAGPVAGMIVVGASLLLLRIVLTRF